MNYSNLYLEETYNIKMNFVKCLTKMIKIIHERSGRDHTNLASQQSKRYSCLLFSRNFGNPTLDHTTLLSNPSILSRTNLIVPNSLFAIDKL